MLKHIRYAKYIIRHKWFALVASWQIGAPIFRALTHDWSKLLPSEWFAYAQYFYGNNEGEGLDAIGRFGLCELAPYGFYAKDRFNLAWLHHQKRNKHHYQYWMITMDSGETFPLPIPRNYVMEMLADWYGAGRAITGKWVAHDWYQKNKDHIHLHPETRSMVEWELDAARVYFAKWGEK